MLLQSLQRYLHLLIFAIFLRPTSGYDSISEPRLAIRQSYPRLSENLERAVSSSRSAKEQEEKEEISVAEPVAWTQDILNEEDTVSPVSRYLDVLERAPTFGTLPIADNAERSEKNQEEADYLSKGADDTTRRLFDSPTKSQSESDDEGNPRFTNIDRFRDAKPITEAETEISTKKKNEKKTRSELEEGSSNASGRLIGDIFDREGPRSKLASKNDPEEPEDFRQEKFFESKEELDEVEEPIFRAFNDANDDANVAEQSQNSSTKFSPLGDSENITEESTISTTSKQTRRRNRGKHAKKGEITPSRNDTLPVQSRRAFPGYPVIFSEQARPQTDRKKLQKYEGIDRVPSIKPQLRRMKRKPEMKRLHYDTTVRSRYVRTTVTGWVKNYGDERDVNVNVILPHNALITKFETNVDGQTTMAVVKEKNGTTDLPKAAVNGENVGTILVETRDCDAAAVSVRVPRGSMLNYTVTYEYLLERNLGVYAVPITVHNNMWIKDLSVRWRIQEERNLTTLKTPLIHKTTALALDDSDDPMVCIINEKPGLADVLWKPTIAEQRNISRELGKLSKDGVVGILELIYDVLHDQDPCGQVVRQNEYFAQFFAAPNQPPLTKHVVFILDASDSMQGDPIKQLKTAMHYILDTLQPMDNFTLINFSDEVNLDKVIELLRTS